MTTAATCEWCNAPAPADAAPGWAYCSQRHRQSAWRFRRQVRALGRSAQPKRITFYDPPYLGKHRLYEGHPDYQGPVDPRDILVDARRSDGWALACDEPSLAELLCLARELGHAPRTGVWVRGARPGRTLEARRAFEPILFVPARKELNALPYDEDVLVHLHRPRTSDPAYVIGSKPAAYIGWMLSLVRARPGDELHDAYPGTGGVGRYWKLVNRGALPVGGEDLSAGFRWCAWCRRFAPDPDVCSLCRRARLALPHEGPNAS